MVKSLLLLWSPSSVTTHSDRILGSQKTGGLSSGGYVYYNWDLVLVTQVREVAQHRASYNGGFCVWRNMVDNLPWRHHPLIRTSVVIALLHSEGPLFWDTYITRCRLHLTTAPSTGTALHWTQICELFAHWFMALVFPSTFPQTLL